jgi:hypothetical protein
MRTIYSEMTDEDEGEIIEEILGGLDAHDLLSIRGVYPLVAKHYADEIAERWRTRCEDAAAEAAERRWREAREAAA